MLRFKTTPTSDLFTNHMDIYTFPAYKSQEHQSFVHNHYLNTPELRSNTRLFIPPQTLVHSSMDTIQKSLKRPPVFWGITRTDMFCWDKVSHYLGYNEADTEMTDAEISHTNYAIVGPVRLMPLTPEDPEITSNVIHVWGIALESPTTPDYKMIITANEGNEADMSTAYFNRHVQLIKLYIDSAIYHLESGETAEIRAPMIGAGVFLKAITDKRLKWGFLDLQLEAMCHAMKYYSEKYTKLGQPVPFVLKLCIYTPPDFPDWLIDKYVKLATEYPFFQVLMGRDEGNILVRPETQHPNIVPFVVNAGDSRSMLGNGMDRDLTVEGFIVADANGWNKTYRNTSYLHNPAFCDYLTDRSKWIVL